MGQPKHLWGHWTPVPMPRTGPTTHCIGVYNIMLFTDGCCLEWVRMRCSSKNRKSICRGHCWYCCRAPQINSCVGNTAGIFFNQVFILFHFSLQKRSQKSTVCGLISFLNFNRCSGPASHCCISSHLGYTQTNNDLFPHCISLMQCRRGFLTLKKNISERYTIGASWHTRTKRTIDRSTGWRWSATTWHRTH